MAWGRVREGARAVAEARLAAVADQWRLAAPADDRDAPASPALRVRGWTGSALRGLAVLTVVVLAIAAYAAWQGRPRAIAQAPITVATGAALPGAESAPAAAESTPEPASMAASMPVTAPAPSPSAEVVVHVTGLVARPGLVRLPAGSRVADAIAEAGGVTQRRAADSVNLARVLTDGEQVVVTHTPAAAAPAPVGAAAAPAVVDLNTATADSLDALPGVGPVIAARIIAWRTSNGPFRSVDELGEVSGIGDAILAQLRPLVRV